MAASDYAHTTIPKFPLAKRGASTDGKQTSGAWCGEISGIGRKIQRHEMPVIELSLGRPQCRIHICRQFSSSQLPALATGSSSANEAWAKIEADA